MLVCPGHRQQRDVLTSKVHDAIRDSDEVGMAIGALTVQDYESGSPNEKLCTLLGAQSGAPKTDRLIDRAIRKFLKRSWKIRSDFHSVALASL